MAPRLSAVDEMILQLTDELLSSPLLGDQVRVAILEFSDRAEIVLPLSDLTELRTIPRLHSKGRTAYAPIFRLLSRVIGHDLRLLRARDVVVYRPVVLFITDGEPTDMGWNQSYFELKNQFKLNFVLILLGDVSSRLLDELQSTYVFDMRDREDQSDLGHNLFRVVHDFTRTLVTSIARATTSQPLDSTELNIGDQSFKESDRW
jgi:uncharacterized protein YegL